MNVLSRFIHSFREEKGPSPLETLPAIPLMKILSHLDENDFFHLKATSSRLWKAIEETNMTIPRRTIEYLCVNTKSVELVSLYTIWFPFVPFSSFSEKILSFNLCYSCSCWEEDSGGTSIPPYYHSSLFLLLLPSSGFSLIQISLQFVERAIKTSENHDWFSL